MPELGTVHSARVVMLKAFGAFVRIEGFRKEGLVHISQLVNGRRVETPDEVVTPGDEVKVVVLSTDNGRLSVSMRQVDQATGEVVGDSRGGGGGGDRRGPQGGGEPLPELYSILKAEVAKLEGFGAFCRLEGMRKQGLLHISQVANSRVEAEDLPEILAVGQEVFVKVIGADEVTGKIALSMKLVSQREGRDLDPSHVEAAAEGDRRSGRAGPGGGGAREREGAMAAMQVPEYGGKQRGGGGADYAMVSDGEDEQPAASSRGTYNLKMPNGAAPPPPPEQQPLDAGQRRQVELAAQLLAKASSKKAKKEKKEKKKKDKERKREKKEKKERKKSHKHEKKSKRDR